MNISGKKINELDSITPTLQTVLPAVYINGREVVDTTYKLALNGTNFNNQRAIFVDCQSYIKSV